MPGEVNSGIIDDPMQERTEGPTPAGGAYAIAYFSDGKGNRVPKSKASAMEIVEYSRDGKVILRTYMEK